MSVVSHFGKLGSDLAPRGQKLDSPPGRADALEGADHHVGFYATFFSFLPPQGARIPVARDRKAG